MDPSTDFLALRMAYSKSADYNPYNDDRDNRTAMREAFENEDFEGTIKYAEELLKKNYVDLEAHRTAAKAQSELKNTERAKYHAYVHKGLLQSILKSGDGKRPETAFVVIVVSEEYAAMQALKVSRGAQSLVELDGHSFDLHEAENETGEPVTLYFNIDRPLKWLRESLNKK